MVNMYKLELTKLQQEILRVLFIKAGVPLNQRRLANVLGVSPPAIMKALPILKDKGLVAIQQDKESKRWAIEMNSDSHIAMQMKMVDNLRQVYESRLADFLEEELAGATIILFGSYSRGEDTQLSDIDIAVIEHKYKVLNLNKYEKLLSRTVNVNFYESWSGINKHLRNNILSGILLHGGIEI